MRVVDQMRLLGLAASLRRASYNRGLIRAAKELAPSRMIVEVSDLADPPLFNQDLEDATARAQAHLRDAFVFTGAA